MARTKQLVIDEPLEDRIKQSLKGRLPKTYWNAEVADRILTAISNGDSLATALKREGINPRTFAKWLSVKDFRDRYMDSRRIQAEIMAHEIIAIADDASRDRIVGNDGKIRFDMASVNRARLRIDTRKFILAKVLPKIYGDRIALTDADGENLRIDLPWLQSRNISRSVSTLLPHQAKAIDISPIESVDYTPIPSDSKSELSDDGEEVE
jgi:hypothetical protein